MDSKEFLSLIAKLKQPGASPQDRAATRAEIIRSAKDFEAELARLLLGERNPDFQIELLNLVGATRNGYFVPALQQILGSSSRIEVLQTAATNLGKLGSAGLETLLGLLQHPNPNVRLGAIYGLAASGDTRAIPHLANLLDDPSEAKVWWPGPKAGGYLIGREAASAVDTLAGERLAGNKHKIARWLEQHPME